MRLVLSLDNPADYKRFLAIRRLPRYSFTGREAWIPDEYAAMIGLPEVTQKKSQYVAPKFFFDYQAAGTRIAIHKRKYALFWQCGAGKTLPFLDFAQHSVKETGKPGLIVSPKMVIPQTLDEHRLWFPDSPVIEQLAAKDLPKWLKIGVGLAITNYEALKPGLDGSRLGCLIPDESSTMKSHGGKWAKCLIHLGRGVPNKLCCTGTPAPNDRIEYANHAVFLDQARTVNEFLARYFVNRGQTDNRWELKPHALRPFYRDLSHWSLFLSDPSVYGWEPKPLPPIQIHIHDVGLTAEQRQAVQDMTGQLEVGGITKRNTMARLGKGFGKNGQKIASGKPAFIKELVDSWPKESTIIWCMFNDEQKGMAKLFPDAANIAGETPYEKRLELIADFKSRKRMVMISKPKILGYGLNLQVATRQVFSSCHDSYESFVQAIKRSNRYGAEFPLNVHLPVTEIELPMMQNVLRKAKRVNQDTFEQETLFREIGFHAA